MDHLKDFKNDSGNKDLQSSARKAISYLNENFKSRHPRFYGQSYEDFIQHVGKDSAPDDEILQTCLRIKSLCSNKKVVRKLPFNS